jgi:hypothetical protein
MARRYWFKPKSFGYGATPSTWEGWVCVLAFVLLVGGLSWVLLGPDPSAAAWVVWALLVIVLTLSFAIFTKRKTDGDWRWRGGRTTAQ